MTKNIEKKESKSGTGNMLNSLKRNIERNNSREVNRRKVITDARSELKELKTSAEFLEAKGKLAKFMSVDGIHYEWQEDLLKGYHFETVNWWNNIKPQPEAVVKEVKTLNDRFQKIIDSYLKADPAKIKELQIKLNDWINYWMVIEDKKSPTGRYTINPINVEILKNILQGTGMELTDNWWATKRRYTIREDWKLGPQTFAVLCCFKKEYRKTTTTNSNRRPQQRK